MLSTRNFFNSPIPRSQFSFYLYCSLEGKKKTLSSKTSANRTCALSAGLGILLQASSTLAMSFSLRAYGFSFFSTKSRTTKIICFGLSDPKSLRLSSRMTSSISSWAPLKVPICWIQILIRRVCEMAKAKREFLLSIFYVIWILQSFPHVSLSHCPPRPRWRCWMRTPHWTKCPLWFGQHAVFCLGRRNLCRIGHWGVYFCLNFVNQWWIEFGIFYGLGDWSTWLGSRALRSWVGVDVPELWIVVDDLWFLSNLLPSGHDILYMNKYWAIRIFVCLGAYENNFLLISSIRSKS